MPGDAGADDEHVDVLGLNPLVPHGTTVPLRLTSRSRRVIRSDRPTLVGLGLRGHRLEGLEVGLG